MPTFATYNAVTYTLTKDPASFSVEYVQGGILESSFEAGYKQRRPRFTRRPRTWSLGYLLPIADKTVLESLVAAINEANSFTWTNPDTESTIEVCFKSLPRFSYIAKGNQEHWRCEFTLEEV